MSIRVVFGEGALESAGTARAGELGVFARAHRCGQRDCGGRASWTGPPGCCDAVGIVPFFFHDFDANPDTAMVEAGRAYAAAGRVDGIVALGGGSSLDCAKGINFVLTNGGSMRDYRGHGKAAKPMLPSIGIPTTAGTGSEAQSYAIISDAETHAKMACGDEKAAFRIAILDPALTVSQPRRGDGDRRLRRDLARRRGVRDEESHAASRQLFAGEAWRLLEAQLRARARRRRATSPPAARCCAAPTWPAPRSSCRCSARPTPAPIR